MSLGWTIATGWTITAIAGVVFLIGAYRRRSARRRDFGPLEGAGFTVSHHGIDAASIGGGVDCGGSGGGGGCGGD